MLVASVIVRSVVRDTLLDAAARVPATAPAYLTIAFQRNHLLALSNKLDQARANVDQILRLPNDRLSPSTRNLFLALRMQAAKNLDEFLQFAPRQPLGVLLSIDVDDPELCDRAPGCVEANGPLFDSDGAVELTETMPTSVLLQAAASTRLPHDLRLQVAEESWVRAILLDQDEAARQLAPVLSSLDPDLAAPIKTYGEQPSPAERRFAAVFLILSRPGLVPYVSAGVSRYGDDNKPMPPSEINSYRQNWWCTFAPAPPPGTPYSPAFVNTGMTQQRMNANFGSGLATLYPQGKPVLPSFLTSGEKDAAAREWASLLKVPAAPDWLGQQVLDWAKTHPDDSRVPEALNRVVVSSRHGCNDANSGMYSEQAFTLLHRRYPTSTWTANTPYWFK